MQTLKGFHNRIVCGRFTVRDATFAAAASRLPEIRRQDLPAHAGSYLLSSLRDYRRCGSICLPLASPVEDASVSFTRRMSGLVHPCFFAPGGPCYELGESTS